MGSRKVRRARSFGTNTQHSLDAHSIDAQMGADSTEWRDEVNFLIAILAYVNTPRAPMWCYVCGVVRADALVFALRRVECRYSQGLILALNDQGLDYRFGRNRRPAHGSDQPAWSTDERLLPHFGL